MEREAHELQRRANIRRKIFGTEVAELLEDTHTRAIFVEKVSLLKYIYKKRTVIKAEFFMSNKLAKDLEGVLDPCYFEFHREVVKRFQGELRFKLKEIHHI